MGRILRAYFKMEFIHAHEQYTISMRIEGELTDYFTRVLDHADCIIDALRRQAIVFLDENNCRKTDRYFTEFFVRTTGVPQLF